MSVTLLDVVNAFSNPAITKETFSKLYVEHKIPKPNGTYRTVYAPNSQVKAFSKHLKNFMVKRLNNVRRARTTKYPIPLTTPYVAANMLLPTPIPIFGLDTSYTDFVVAMFDRIASYETAYIIELDIKDFYPSVKYRHIKKLISDAYFTSKYKQVGTHQSLLHTYKHAIPPDMITYMHVFFAPAQSGDLDDAFLVQGNPVASLLAAMVLGERLTANIDKILYNTSVFVYADNIVAVIDGARRETAFDAFTLSMANVLGEDFKLNKDKTKYRIITKQDIDVYRELEQPPNFLTSRIFNHYSTMGFTYHTKTNQIKVTQNIKRRIYYALATNNAAALNGYRGILLNMLRIVDKHFYLRKFNVADIQTLLERIDNKEVKHA